MCRSRTSNTAPGPVLLVFLVLILGCGASPHDAQSPQGPGAQDGQQLAAVESSSPEAEQSLSPPASPASPASPAKALINWEDPEPPEAQALAESLVAEPFNEDKTSRLVMHITTLLNQTSGIEGFATSLSPKAATLADRLDALQAEESETEIRIRLSGAILFDFDSSAVRPDAERTLGELLEIFKSFHDRPIRVEGHTDSIASENYNQKLSEERAQSVARWLIAHGVRQGRIKTLGYGESRPLADNTTAEGRQKNRRVEIIIEKK